jgi:hypothetical protein
MWRCEIGMRTLAILLLAAATSSAAGKVAPEALIDLARSKGGSVEFRDAVLASLPDAELKKGIAFVGVGPDFLCVLEADTEPRLYIDDRVAGPMKKITGTKLWYSLGTLATGTSHEYHYEVNGSKLGGRTDVPAFLPESYSQPGVPQGKLSDKLIHTSKLYGGMVSEYWTYVPAKYDPATPAALMVWQDGQGHIQRDGGARTLNVIDNLIQQKKIPVMIQVFISPGKIGEKAMRSIEYDTNGRSLRAFPAR